MSRETEPIYHMRHTAFVSYFDDKIDHCVMYCSPWLRMTNAHMTGFFCKFIFCRRHSFYQLRDRVTTKCDGRNAFSLIGICFIINFLQSIATAFLNLALKRKPYSRSFRCIYSCTNSGAHRIFFGRGFCPLTSFPSPPSPCAPLRTYLAAFRSFTIVIKSKKFR